MYCRRFILTASAVVLFTIKTAPAASAIPAINVFVYSFPGLSPAVLHGAETEAEHILRPVRVKLAWVDCTTAAVPLSCLSPQFPRDLVVRFLPKALSQATASALGISGSSEDYATAFLFYDRMLALRNEQRSILAIAGRVLAHELTHLLLPHEDHTDIGLMRGQWSTMDLEMTSAACCGLSARSAELMRRDVLRRTRATAATARSRDIMLSEP